MAARSVLRCALFLHFVALSMPGTADQLATMVHLGFAAKTTERVVSSLGQVSEIENFKITEESERLATSITGARLCHSPGARSDAPKECSRLRWSFAQSWRRQWARSFHFLGS